MLIKPRRLPEIRFSFVSDSAFKAFDSQSVFIVIFQRYRDGQGRKISKRKVMRSTHIGL